MQIVQARLAPLPWLPESGTRQGADLIYSIESESLVPEGWFDAGRLFSPRSWFD